MKLLASNKVVDSEYELAANDIRRIRTLMEDIDSQGIQFKYLITMNYPYRITDYTKVLYHSKHLKYVLQRNFDNPKVFITNEKHTRYKYETTYGCNKNILFQRFLIQKGWLRH